MTEEATKEKKKNKDEEVNSFIKMMKEKMNEAFASFKTESQKPETKSPEEKKEERSWGWDLGIGAGVAVGAGLLGYMLGKRHDSGGNAEPVIGSRPPME